MLTFTGYNVENVKDPFGILTGKRYEFVVQLDVPEDDELYVENGVSARAIIKVDEDQVSIVSYDLQGQLQVNCSISIWKRTRKKRYSFFVKSICQNN